MKKIISCVLAVTMVFAMAACGNTATPTPDSGNATVTTAPPDAGNAATPTPEAVKITKIGVSMPTQSLQRWNQDGANLKEQLTAAGFTVDLQFANDEVATQVNQLETMILGGCQVLVIAAIDGASLGTVMASAKEKDVIVIAYDRLIVDTDAVSYYATFDNFKVGVIQGEYIEEKLNLKTAAGPFNMELFAGSPDDTNAGYFFGGAMSILQPYIDSGKIKIVSGQTKFEEIAILGWKTETAQARMDNLITANYATGTKIDAVLSPNDSLAIGIANALENVGYGSADKPFPIITGQDCDVPNCKYMIAGKQSMSVFKDTRTLAAQVVTMVKAIGAGTEVPVNDTTTYDNNVKVVPSFLCTPVFGDKDNLDALLIDTGYYERSQIYD